MATIEKVIGIVYSATNKTNCKVYIGQTICSLEFRIFKHKSDSHNKKAMGYDSKFYRAIRKYGIDNFEWKILNSNVAIDELDICEIKRIKEADSFYNGYNSTTGGQNGGRVVSAETKRKISDSQRGRIPWNKGLMTSESTKIKISKAKKGQRKGIPRPRFVIDAMLEGKKKLEISEEYRKKMSQSHIGKKPSAETRLKMSKSHGTLPFVVYKDNKLVGEWRSISACAEDLRLYISCIGRCLSTERKSHKGYVFRYK